MDKRKVIRISEVEDVIESLRLEEQPKEWGVNVKPWEQWNDNLNAIKAKIIELP